MRGSVPTSRRTFLRLAAASGLATSGLGAVGPALAQTSTAATTTVPTAELMATPPLPDDWMGSPTAPVTMIEYASLTCTHCAAFRAETWPSLKSQYIDTGKVRFVLREFPLNALDTAAFMLARCIDPEKRNALIDLLYGQQNNWAFVPKPLEALENTVKQAGVSKDAFETCLKNQKLYDQVNAERDKAGQQFKIDATPTFFINGAKHTGEMSVAELHSVLDPLVKS